MISHKVTVQRPEKQMAREEVTELAGRAKPHPCKHQLPTVKVLRLQKGSKEKATDFMLYLHLRIQPITLMMMSMAGMDADSFLYSDAWCFPSASAHLN